MSDCKSLQDTRRDCECHAVFIPKYRRNVIYKGLRKELGEVGRDEQVIREYIQHQEKEDQRQERREYE